MSILYITQNGITDHIGRSQVAPYVIGLAREGFKIHVLSAEKPGRDALIKRYRALFDEVGVNWTIVRYHIKPPLLGQFWTHHRMGAAARRIIQDKDIQLVHCRNHIPAMLGYSLKQAFGIKYIFDFRDFSPDGGLLKARGLTRIIYQRMKKLEMPLVLSADKIVCLTHKAEKLLSKWYFPDVEHPADRFHVIPCCADFDHFDPERVTCEEVAVARRLAALEPKDFVLLYLGSLGSDYLLTEMLCLFRELKAIKPEARFLFVSNNGKDILEKACEAIGLDHGDIRFITADRDEIPALIKLANLSVIFIRADLTKAGCSPTKLAELFACGVPVIANSGVGDLDKILSLERNGSITVHDMHPKSLNTALIKVLEANISDAPDIRSNSSEFSLKAGIESYAKIYGALL